MKALILAAGLGTRLAPITDSCPKSMVPVNGKPIIIKQIENLLENAITDITIIAGYKSEVLIKAVTDLFPTVKVLINKDYATTNNMYSAYLGRDSINMESFLMMNADVFFDSSVIYSLCQYNYENAIVTDIGRFLEESMKVVEENKRLIKISKAITKEEAFGSSIDVYKFSKEGCKAFFEKCAEYIEQKDELKLWSEVALNEILSSVEFVACPLQGRWFEIDNLEDLRKAEKLFLD